jgi:hypothetical protein
MKKMRTALTQELPEDEVNFILRDYESFYARLHWFSEDRQKRIRETLGTSLYGQYLLYRTKLLREIRKMPNKRKEL